MLRAIIVDDEELSVKRLKKILSESGEIEICHAFLNPLEAYEFVKANPIQLAFLDISMPEINGLRLSSLLFDLDASIDVVFVTAYDDYAVQAFDMSALDYLMKPVTVQRMSKTLDKIRKRNLGGAVEPSMEVLRRNQDKTLRPLVESLTNREMEILRALSSGLSNKEIALHFEVTEGTVKNHVFNIYSKLGAKRRAQAIAWARELRLLE